MSGVRDIDGREQPAMSSSHAVDGRLAHVVAPVSWEIPPVTNLRTLEALPPAAKQRETKKIADSFASTGRNIFVHYATPILDKRRQLLLSSGITKKRYPKAAAQLWQILDPEEAFYWNEVARELRLCMKKEVLSPKGCLIHAGRVNDKAKYVWHAEVAVAAYLKLPPPQEASEAKDASSTMDYGNEKELAEDLDTLTFSHTNNTGGTADCKLTLSLKKKTSNAHTPQTNAIPAKSTGDEDVKQTELLDTLPDRFEYDQKTLYSHFARYDYNEVRQAEGKHRTAMLRQLADLFDKTGKMLFYYYAVPRLCKQSHPPTARKTVTGQAADVWRFMAGTGKEKWRKQSAKVKKQLGDGDVMGLEMLQLDSLDVEVLRLHELAEAALSDQGGN
ncbi:hypothetical protein LTR37_016394 [Vermiconidia calcicola]|uniref:Uncharacterized protein n=1 Tax=Vermiconidia calcicola TaxID=1690605 RepID=A0ACC3MPI1_9PEZI|nr:hypothetical protein LTR37_016394 [Vermiconidia calcicola]